MDIKTIPINKLKPAKYNPRKDLRPGDEEYEKIKQSIDTFDLVEPIVWNKRNQNVISGHQRLKILKARGDKEVVVSVVDLGDNEEAALNIALNKITGEWDMGKLTDVLNMLSDSDFDLTLTGFEPDILDGLNLDKTAMWDGMPEYNSEELLFNNYKNLIVHFKTEKNYTDFMNLIGQKLTKKTKSICFPKEEEAPSGIAKDES